MKPANYYKEHDSQGRRGNFSKGLVARFGGEIGQDFLTVLSFSFPMYCALYVKVYLLPIITSHMLPIPQKKDISGGKREILG